MPIVDEEPYIDPENPNPPSSGTSPYHTIIYAYATCQANEKGRVVVNGVRAFNGAIIQLLLRNSKSEIVADYGFPANVDDGTVSFADLTNDTYSLISYDQNTTGKTWTLIVNCQHVAKNTGYKGWKQLEQYDTNTGIATGPTKLNITGDPDYVAPISDPAMCPIPTV